MHASSSQLPPASFMPLHCALDEVVVRILPGDPPPATPEMLERWEAAARANPRLFNGPILRYISHEPAAAGGVRIDARQDTYQRYGMQRHDAASADPDCDIYHLAVTGVVTAHDPGGDGDAVLLGRRGGATFVYPELWEHAPGGGLESADVYTQLLVEMEEELGLGGLVDGSRRDDLLESPGAGDCLGLAIDPNTPSVDVVVRLRLRAGAERAISDASWEYGSTRLVPIRRLGEFLGEQGGGAIIPPAVAIWRGMGWI